MSHTESGAVAVTTNGNGIPHHKKLRKKRKELNALVPEEKIRRKSGLGSRHDLLYSDSDDIEFSTKGSQPMFGNGGFFGILPGAITLLVLVVIVVGLGATLKLLMTTRKDLDALHTRLNAVEASGYELPAKFHESHVRLQLVEKNHTAIWAIINELSEDMTNVKTKLSSIETSLNKLQKSLAVNPSLMSLPNNVVELQKSVSTFGASLRDVETSFKSNSEEREKMKTALVINEKSIVSIQEELISLHNASFLPSSVSRDGVIPQQPVAKAVVNIKNEISLINSAFYTLNSSIISKFDTSNEEYSKVFQKQIAPLSQKLAEIHKTLDDLPVQNLSSVPSEVNNLKEIMAQFGSSLANISNTVDIVKGVERKLEGSQVQMASGLSAIKQHMQKIDRKLSNITTPSPNPSSDKKHKRSIGRIEKQYSSNLT